MLTHNYFASPSPPTCSLLTSTHTSVSSHTYTHSATSALIAEYLFSAFSVHKKHLNFSTAIVPVCPPLAVPQNGTITYTANATADFDVGTVVTYSCDQGYALNIENPSRVCTELVGSGTAIWNGTSPSCDCELPDFTKFDTFIWKNRTYTLS